MFEKLLETSRFLIKKSVIAFLLSFKRGHYFNRENTICVFAQPRGGSTWFSNILLHISHSVKIDEPLFRGRFNPNGEMPPKGMGKIKDLDDLNFYYHQPIPKDADFKKAEQFFDRLFRLKYISPYLFEETPFRSLINPRTFIFKFNQANLLLEWLLDRFEITPIVLLRNPFAVVASQLSFYSFSEVVKAGCYKIPGLRFKEYFEPYLETLNKIKYPEEILAARWCINYLPVSKLNDKWLTVYYEHLLINPHKEIERIFNYLKRPVPNKLYSDFYKPSFRGYRDKAYYENADANLEQWRSVLNGEQISRIRNVLKDFGVLEYSGESIV